MKAYKVNVNGHVYEITLEEINKSDIKEAPKAAPVAAPAASAPADGTKITAPMPGNILKINITNGQSVKKGDVLMVLEAMKMENEIMCPCDGKIASVNTSVGTSVEAGALLCSIGA